MHDNYVEMFACLIRCLSSSIKKKSRHRILLFPSPRLARQPLFPPTPSYAVINRPLPTLTPSHSFLSPTARPRPRRNPLRTPVIRPPLRGRPRTRSVGIRRHLSSGDLSREERAHARPVARGLRRATMVRPCRRARVEMGRPGRRATVSMVRPAGSRVEMRR